MSTVPVSETRGAVGAPSVYDVAERDAFVGRLFESFVNTFEILNVEIGRKLGFYSLLNESPATAAELARRAATSERLTREWLEQQSVAGYVRVTDDVNPAQRIYSLPAAHAEVLVNHDSLTYLLPLAAGVSTTAQLFPMLLESFRTGSGVPYSAWGSEARVMQSELNRPSYLQLLGSQWLPSVADVHERLQSDPPARVADLGCGPGWSSIGIARAYPKTEVDGFDLDPESIQMAQRNAADADLASRVRFQVRDASDPELAGRYDLVCAFECLHDMGRPVEALRAARKMLAPGGAVLIMDQNVAETFTVEGSPVERFMYACSTLYCLQQGLADAPSVGTGTMMRPAMLEEYARQAGFSRTEILPITHDFWRFYRLYA